MRTETTAATSWTISGRSASNAEMTSINVQQKDLYGQSSIEKEHIENNTAVRNMMG